MAEPRRADITALRTQRGIKRGELGRRIGKSYKHIWGIERGNHTAAVETLQNIADVLLVPLEAVMVKDDERGAA